MPPHKGFCLLSYGPQLAQVGVFNREGKLVNVSAIPFTVQAVCYWTQRSGNAGMANETDGRWLALSHKSTSLG